MRYAPFPLRQIHLDFHTSPDIPDRDADAGAPGHIEVLEQPIPLHDITIRLRRTAETSRVHSPLASTDLDFQAGAGVVMVRVPRIDTHAVIVFEGRPD